MITKQEYNELLADKGLSEAISTLLTRFQELGELTPTTDLKAIKDEYKVILFQQLLRADKGIKLRYELHRTEQAKLNLINETISLDGYEEIQELQELISIYKNRFANSAFWQLPTTDEQLLRDFKGDVAEAAKGLVVKLEENEDYQKLKQVETMLNNFLASGVLEAGSEDRIYHFLPKLIPFNNETLRVAIDDVKIYHFLEEIKYHKEIKR